MRPRLWWLAPTVAVLVAGEAAWGATGGATLRRQTDFAVTLPADGATVGSGFVLAWRPVTGHGRYAVVVDHTPPAAGRRLTPTDSTLVTDGITALRLTVGARDGASPTLRTWHTLYVVPLDAAGRRAGEQVATVHVRTRS